MGIVKEFREFAIKGNMVDMAVGIIIGAAFGGLVKSLVDDVVMPVVGTIWKADFTDLYIPLTETTREKIAVLAAASPGGRVSLAAIRADAGVVLAYGNFITLCINFLILAFVIFMVVKLINKARKQFEREQASAAPPPPPPTTEDILLLREIRDSLKPR